MGRTAQVRAWRPAVEGVAEVLHARFHDHAYPPHTHDTWTLLLVDDGVVTFDLDRHQHGALGGVVTLLPPHVPHDGRAATAAGFRKRVIYLEQDQLDAALIGAAVDHPGFRDPSLRAAIAGLHDPLAHAGDELEAESRLALVRDQLTRQLRHESVPAAVLADRPLARRLRDLLDASVVEGVSLAEASVTLGATPTHLVRAFGREYGIAPHRYLTGRRVDRARRLLLEGRPPADVAAAVGFYDQAHLARHFRRMLGVTPGGYAGAARTCG